MDDFPLSILVFKHLQLILLGGYNKMSDFISHPQIESQFLTMPFEFM
jgi:hypothetical protein